LPGPRFVFSSCGFGGAASIRFNTSSRRFSSESDMVKPFVVDDSFFIAVGKITIAWALIETPLDAIVAIIFTRTGAKDFEREIPRAFEKKARFVKRAASQCAELSKYSIAIVDLAARARALSDARHRLIHGVVDNFTPVEGDTILIHKITYAPQEHRVETHRTSLSEIADVTAAIERTADEMNFLAWQLSEHFGIAPNQRNKPNGSL
jgi:HAMP domain-containing protein